MLQNLNYLFQQNEIILSHECLFLNNIYQNLLYHLITVMKCSDRQCYRRFQISIFCQRSHVAKRILLINKGQCLLEAQ